MFQNCSLLILFVFNIYLECNSLSTLRLVTTIKDLSHSNKSFSHAESPVWDHENCKLYWVDVLKQNIHSLDYKTKEHRFRHSGYGEVNVVVPIANSSRLLVAVRSALYIMDWDIPGDAGFRLLTVFDVGRPDNVINEGNVDARGRLWAGTKGTHIRHTVIPDEATLYSIQQPDFTPQVKVRPVSISNGLVWSLNSSILYYIDSSTKKIEAFDFVLDSGHISNRRTVFDVVEAGFPKTALPDGMTIDRDGMLWVALMFYGGVIRINPDTGVVMEEFKLPVSFVTSLTWGGEYLEDLIVTTSRRGLGRKATRQTSSGSIFVLRRLNTGGVPAVKFAFDRADNY